MLVLMGIALPAVSQVVCWPTADSTLTVVTCNAFFYDSGGSEGNIAAIDENNSPSSTKFVTFVSQDTTHLKCVFTQFSVNGVMQIYDGRYDNPNKRLIGQFHTSTLDATTGYMPPVFFSTGDALTFVYHGANGDLSKVGWAAEITCEAELVPVSYGTPFLGIANVPSGHYAGAQDSHTIMLDTLNPEVTLEAVVNPTGLFANDYWVSQIPFGTQVFSFTEGVPLDAPFDDQWFSEVVLPFTFTFFGKPYDNVYLSTNALISLDQRSGHCDYNYPVPPVSPPYSAVPYKYKNCIYGVFEDIDCRYFNDYSYGTMGAVRYGVLGEYPCRAFVFNFLNVALYGHHSSTSDYNTYQMVLYEGTNIVDVYVKHRQCCASTNPSGEGIIGLHNNTSSQILLAPGRGMTGWNTDDEAWRFSPVTPPDPNATFTWYADTVDSASVISHDRMISVLPQTDTRYISEYQCTNASGTSFVLRDTTLVMLPEIDSTGVADRDRDFEVYPNPTRDVVYVRMLNTKEMPQILEVVDMQGRPLFSVPAEVITRVDLSRLPTGTYFLRVGNKGSRVSKIVKQ